MKFLAVLSIVFCTTSVLANGLEKAHMWSGRYAGQANAAGSTVNGADALYFNPAGLAGTKKELSVNLSATAIRFSGPITTANQTEEGDNTLLPPGGVLYSHAINEKLGLGVGVFSTGGSASDFGEVDFTTLTGLNAFDPEFKANIQFLEFGLGVGYQVNSKLKVGLGWRVTLTSGQLVTGAVDTSSGVSVIETDLKDLSDSDLAGLRFGLQYQPNTKWGLGLVWRSEVAFNAEGTGEGQLENNGATGTIVPLTSDSVSVKGKFPMALALSGHYHLSDQFSIFTGLEWTQYSRNQVLDLSGDFTTINIDGNDVTLDWSDLYTLRLGSEWRKWSWPVRFGYNYSSRVADKGRALAILVAPGPVHVFTVGTGKAFGKWQFDVAAEYGFISAEVEAGDIPSGAATLAGDYETVAYSLFTTMKYVFD